MRGGSKAVNTAVLACLGCSVKKTTIQYKNPSHRPNLVLLPFQFGRMILKAAQTRFWPPALFSTAHRFFPRRRYMWRLFSKKRSFIAPISNFGLYTLLDGILVKLICSVLNGSQRLQKCNTHFTGYSSGGRKVLKFPEANSSRKDFKLVVFSLEFVLMVHWSTGSISSR